MSAVSTTSRASSARASSTRSWRTDMRAALVQLNASDDPQENAVVAAARVREAAAGGATLVLTPEVTNIMSWSRSHQRTVLAHEEEDATLATLDRKSTRLNSSHVKSRMPSS